MDQDIKIFKIGLIAQIIAGAGIASMMALFLGTMATDSPSSTSMDFIYGASLGFVLVFIPFATLPVLSIKELNKFQINHDVKFNLINAVICTVFFALIPFAIFHFYFIQKLRNHPELENNS